MKRILMIMLMGIFLFGLTSATPYDMGTFPQGECVKITQTCSSCSYVNISINYPNTSLIITNDAMISIGGGGWRYTFCNTSTISDDPYTVYGEGDISGTPIGFSNIIFRITENGINADKLSASGIASILFILCLFLLIAIFFLVSIDNYIGKFVCYWISHLLLVLITFVAWQFGVEGIFGGVALTGIFRVLFLVVTIAVVPMVFLSVAWVVYIHLYNEHFQKLIDKGMSTEEAFSITNKKKGGWFNGK